VAARWHGIDESVGPRGQCCSPSISKEITICTALSGAITRAFLTNTLTRASPHSRAWQSSEIYNGFNGFYDYGPVGVEMKNNIKRMWWRDMVHRR
jgi:hypothetical protein